MTEQLMEEAVSPENWHSAWKAVVANHGAPGIDGLRGEQLVEHLKRHGPTIAAKLLGSPTRHRPLFPSAPSAGTYTPSPVKRVCIPKPGGGERLLGIPTVVDRFVQQLLLQVLTPIYEPRFSARSYGFRPGRSAHEGSPTRRRPLFPAAPSAVRAAQAYVRQGKRFVVDLDIEKFFDHVNHNLLMHQLRQVVGDVRVRTLIGRYLKAGIMIEGVVQESEEGRPQGGPLSPLLANIYLDPLDKELESRGLAQVRYADDCNIYVGSQASAERVLQSVTRWIEKKLRLRINAAKSGAGPSQERKFLGLALSAQGTIEVAAKSVTRFKEKVRELWEGRQSKTNLQLRTQWNQYLRGWAEYYRLAEERRWLRAVEGWVRRHIRKFYWQRWHCAKGRLQAFRGLGLARHHWASARSSRGAWRMAATPAMPQALSNARLRHHGYLLPSILWAR